MQIVHWLSPFSSSFNRRYVTATRAAKVRPPIHSKACGFEPTPARPVRLGTRRSRCNAPQSQPQVRAGRYTEGCRDHPVPDRRSTVVCQSAKIAPKTRLSIFHPISVACLSPKAAPQAASPILSAFAPATMPAACVAKLPQPQANAPDTAWRRAPSRLVSATAPHTRQGGPQMIDGNLHLPGGVMCNGINARTRWS